jgi:CRISPR/Cas system-associated endonuclease Cas1
LIHGSKRDQGSLVFDLIEEFRAPFADRLVIAMIGRGFQPKMGEYGFLRSKTRKQLAVSFLKGWHRAIDWRSQKIAPAAILEKQASSLAKLFNQEGQYHAFKMRW